MSENIVAILNEGADENAMVARVLRHVEDRPVAPRAEDFLAALKYDPAVVIRLRGPMADGEALDIDCRYRNGVVQYRHDYRQRGAASRKAFLFDVRTADDVEVLHHRDSQFGEGYTCADCGAESFDPDSEFIQSRNTVQVTCPACGAVDEVPRGTDPMRSREEVSS
jgi:DNA-directed RNA polymerase subunit RPC12/RpoP